jgi:triphosphatase
LEPLGARPRTAGSFHRPPGFFAGRVIGAASLTQFDPAPAEEASTPTQDIVPSEGSIALEFALDALAAGRFSRHPAIASARAGRSRGQAEEVIWLDTADGALAAHGVALERQKRGAAKSSRSLPPTGAFWAPASPPEPLADPQPESSLPLVPIAAFSGRRTIIPLVGGIEAIMRVGKLRAVADEQPASRLCLQGPVGPVLDLARRLAVDVPIVPPGATLAEAGRALARGETPRPRRKGPPDLAGLATVEAALRGAIGHLLEVMLHYAPACQLGTGPEGVHQTRVALRRLRSILKTFRPAAGCPELAAFDAGLKSLADLLGPARDWDVFLSGVGAATAAAMPGTRGADPRLAALLRAAEQQRAAAYSALRRGLDSAAFRRLIIDGIALLHTAPWREAPAGVDLAERAARLAEPLPAFAASLLDKRWRKLRSDGAEIEAHSAEALHELRLEAKRLRYAAELFAPIWPNKATRRFLRRLAAVQEDFGIANDTAVARALVASLAGRVPAWAIGAVEGFASARGTNARGDGLQSWEALLALDPFWTEA